MAWRRSGEEQLLEPMITRLTDVYIRAPVS